MADCHAAAKPLDKTAAGLMPKHSVFQPQKGIMILQNQLLAVQFRRIRAEKEDHYKLPGDAFWRSMTRPERILRLHDHD
jgi:hypothetical protein